LVKKRTIAEAQSILWVQDMHRTADHPLRLRRDRRAEWNRYVTGLSPDDFGATFWINSNQYQIEGWLQRNPVYSVYLIRKDDKKFAASTQEVERRLTGLE
jgi:hypothetical protein